jgi:ABC-type multidrug transport system ATPase subunit
VRDVSFAIDEGSVVALLGGNGAGKTTTLKCLLGITSFEGAVSVGGFDAGKNGRDVRRLMGYMPQLPALNEDHTCGRALEFACALRGTSAAEVVNALAAVNLHDHARTRIRELSGGMRQRLALAASLIGSPRVLLLDEPTASLDAESREEFRAIVRRLRDEGRTIILSTHLYDRLEELVDRALILRDGTLAFDGTPAELAKRTHGRRYLVSINGHAPESLFGALAGLGIGPERVTSMPVPWDDIAVMFPKEGQQ